MWTPSLIIGVQFRCLLNDEFCSNTLIMGQKYFVCIGPFDLIMMFIEWLCFHQQLKIRFMSCLCDDDYFICDVICFTGLSVFVGCLFDYNMFENDIPPCRFCV